LCRKLRKVVDLIPRRTTCRASEPSPASGTEVAEFVSGDLLVAKKKKAATKKAATKKKAAKKKK